MAEIQNERTPLGMRVDYQRWLPARQDGSLPGFLSLTNNAEPATHDFRFTPSRPRSAISYSPAPSCRREIARSGTAAPLRESIAAPSLRPSCRRRSAGTRESVPQPALALFEHRGPVGERPFPHLQTVLLQ